MLQELRMRNYIIFEDARMEFSDGLNVITGETGSGKSIIIDAIEILCGGRFIKEHIKSGADKSLIEGIFYINDNLKEMDSIIDDYGIDREDDGLFLVQREVNINGRSSCRVNGQTVTQSMLKNITKRIIDVIAQNENQLLFKIDSHMGLIDDFGDANFKKLKKQIEDNVKEIEFKKTELKSLCGSTQERERELDLLKYQINEIESSQLKVKEYEELINRKTILVNAEQLYNTISQIYKDLYANLDGHTNAIDILGCALANIEDIIEYDFELEEFKKQIENSLFSLEDLRNPLRQYREGIEFNSNEIDTIEERLSTIEKLFKKYGNSIKKVLEYKNKIEIKYNELISSEELIKRIQDKIIDLENDYFKKANQLSTIRMKLSKDIEKKIEKELNDLNMQGASFIVENHIKKHVISRNGIDNLEFLLSANPGEIERSLAKIASGGEISRIMLAIKTVLIKAEKYNCIVFDEIDAGIGGLTANKVAEKLYSIAEERQTICITHLSQIAAKANNHICVTKIIKKDKTYAEIKILNENERIDEIAKMLSGEKDQNLSYKLAEKLLK